VSDQLSIESGQLGGNGGERQVQGPRLDSPRPGRTPRELFLVGLFETWLAPDGKPSKEQKQDARRAARVALRELGQL
jgi:hypothetical protein